jgi:nucleotide-binding universal stress UspA family protein
MAISDILVCIDPSSAGATRLKLALNLARSQKAYLTGAFVMPRRQAVAVTGGATGFAEEAAAAVEILREGDGGDGIEQRFNDELRESGIDGEWRPLAVESATPLIDLAKSADLTILGQRPRNSRAEGAARLRPEDVVMAVGRPVLVVPFAGDFERVGRRVLIAWDGTREADRALADALPLIEDAEVATVMYVGAQEGEIERTWPALERVVHHLERHGVPAKPKESLRGDLAVSDILLSRAADLDADLIVAGGYHRSPVREALLGGVSRELLEHMTVPVLMSH